MTELTRLLPPTQRPPIDPLGDPFGSDDGDAPNGPVIVSSGLYHERLPLSGRSVGEVRRQLASRMDIDPSSTAVIDGETVGDETSTRLRAGQVLAFVRLAGEKGC